jgi:hypothetical protein
MKKIIQITSDHGTLHALTEDGKVYYRVSNKKEYSEDSKKIRYVSKWEEVEDKVETEWEEDLPF